MTRALLLVAIAACGRVGFSPRALGDGRADAFDPDAIAPDATVFGDGMLATATCGTTVLVQDGFDTGMPGPQFGAYTASGLTLVETASHWEIDFASSVSAGMYSGYKTTTSFPTDGLCASIEALQIPNGDGDIYMKMTATNQQIELFEHSGQLDLRTHAGKQVATLATVPFDPVATRYWRLRQQGGVTYWEISSDGATYYTLAQATFVTASALSFEFGGGTFQTLANGGAGWFDSALLVGP